MKLLNRIIETLKEDDEPIHLQVLGAICLLLGFYIIAVGGLI